MSSIKESSRNKRKRKREEEEINKVEGATVTANQIQETEVKAAPVTNAVLKSPANEEDLNQDFSEDEDDGEWITPDNLHEAMLKDEDERVETTSTEQAKVKAALATGDFAIQNVALQIGLNLMNYTSGLQIKRVRNYMFRCHACFTLTPIPKDGTPKHFCPACGGATLLRCAVSVNAKTGEIVPHLKKNFEWHRREVIPSLMRFI
ncbi:unnamed protein product [Ambrosiozyma monospora]|uniref:Unnamed protein product n=1 Tax=Ambrosiozyma monospora TaxID=43982 RepID=A0A9W6T8Y2_AMBMO|nr:unnamed protein product [Ambrosiozyma monospora]